MFTSVALSLALAAVSMADATTSDFHRALSNHQKMIEARGRDAVTNKGPERTLTVKETGKQIRTHLPTHGNHARRGLQAATTFEEYCSTAVALTEGNGRTCECDYDTQYVVCDAIYDDGTYNYFLLGYDPNTSTHGYYADCFCESVNCATNNWCYFIVEDTTGPYCFVKEYFDMNSELGFILDGNSECSACQMCSSAGPTYVVNADACIMDGFEQPGCFDTGFFAISSSAKVMVSTVALFGALSMMMTTMMILV